MARVEIRIEGDAPIEVVVDDPDVRSCYVKEHAADLVERTIAALAKAEPKESPDG